MSGDAVGFVLLVASGVTTGLGWDLSRRGLSSTDAAARAAQKAASEAQKVTAQAQEAIVSATGDQAAVVAQNTSAVAAKSSELSDAIGGVHEALKAMTGVFAPARVCFAFTLLLLVAALISFDLLAVAVSNSAGNAP